MKLGEREPEEYGSLELVSPYISIERGLLCRLIDAGIIDYGPVIPVPYGREHTYKVTEEGKQFILDHFAV